MSSQARALLGLALLGLACGAGCGPRAPDARPLVAVSVPPQAWFVDQIAGGRVRVEVMVPPGASPTSYAPTFAQLRAMEEAVLYVRVGHRAFPFEAAWLDRLLAEGRGVRVVDSSAGIPFEAGDPHVWLAPADARIMARNIAAALADVLPDEGAVLAASRARLLAEIDAVDADLRAVLGPHRGQVFVVFHPAWGTLARAYGLRQLAIEEGGKEPGPRQLLDLIARTRALGVRVVFAQPEFDRASAALVAREIGARLEIIDPLAYDWASNLRAVARKLAEGSVPWVP
jgi:zinc transport system substrate-binding protein